MPRLASIVAAAFLIALPLCAQDVPQVGRVSVAGSSAIVEVEIRTTAAVTPQTLALSSPDRIVIDLPGAVPAHDLRSLNVNRGALKAVRTGVFQKNPPVTRIVLDLTSPQPFQIFSTRNSVMVKVGSAAAAAKAAQTSIPITSEAPPEPEPEQPMRVTFQDGLLKIHANRVTLAQVLMEVHRLTGAEIAIPPGAESEEIAADLGPAPAREVLADLLNGSQYNFIFIGNERGHTFRQAILTTR